MSKQKPSRLTRPLVVQSCVQQEYALVTRKCNAHRSPLAHMCSHLEHLELHAKGTDMVFPQDCYLSRLCCSREQGLGSAASMDSHVGRLLQELGLEGQITVDEFRKATKAAGCKVMEEKQEKVKHPLKTCKCGRQLCLREDKQVKAKVLDVGGWREVWHVPMRRRNSNCSRHDKYVWYNYFTQTKTEHSGSGMTPSS